ncbi:reverse transcriptase, partial [Ixodes scapularis]
AAGVKLNRPKRVFSALEVKVLSVIVSDTGVSPDPEKIKTLPDLEAPSDISGVRRLLGMANHLGRFLPHLADTTAPLRALVQKISTWVWGPAKQQAFQKLKGLLSSNACMGRYDITDPTTVFADTSSCGLAAVLLQQQPSGEQCAVAFASRSLTPTESRYSQTEKEALAVAWTVERSEQFVRGIPVRCPN